MTTKKIYLSLELLLFSLLITFFIPGRIGHCQDKILNPPPGIWILRPGAGTLACPTGSKMVRARSASEVHIALLDNGDRIKFDSPEGAGILSRDIKGPEGGHYQGTISGKEGTINLDLLFTEIKGSSQMLGEMVGSYPGNCTFKRGVFMEWSKATPNIRILNK